MREVLITAAASGRRLDKYLLKYLDKSTKANVYKLLRKRIILLNGGRAQGSEMLEAGDRLTLYLAEDTIKGLQSERTAKTGKPLNIVFEDENVLLVNKPAGLLTQKAAAGDADSLADWVSAYLGPGDVEEGFSGAPVNRLDRNTSGLCICAKNLKTAQALSKSLRERKLDKFYLAVVKGKVNRELTLVGGYERDEAANKAKLVEGEEIEIDIEPVRPGRDLSLVEVKLITGKTHQIRLQLAEAGHPILGDYKYGEKQLNDKWKYLGVNSQLLHAHRLVFTEKTGHLAYLAGREFIAPVPEIFKTIETHDGGAQ